MVLSLDRYGKGGKVGEKGKIFFYDAWFSVKQKYHFEGKEQTIRAIEQAISEMEERIQRYVKITYVGEYDEFDLNNLYPNMYLHLTPTRKGTVKKPNNQKAIETIYNQLYAWWLRNSCRTKKLTIDITKICNYDGFCCLSHNGAWCCGELATTEKCPLANKFVEIEVKESWKDSDIFGRLEE